tara:strand:+ start:2718 stop:3995 length:1278 start_codon:yes stop_codon:yes gene_type:complete
MARGRRRGRKKRSRSRSRSRSSNRCKSGERKNYMGKCVKKGKRKNKSCGTGYKKDWMSGDCVKKKNKVSRKKGKKISSPWNYIIFVFTLPFSLLFMKRLGITEGFKVREGYRDRKKRERPPKGTGQSILASLKVFFGTLIGVMALVYISSGWMHLIHNIEKYIPYPNMNNNGGLPELLRKVGQIIRERPVQTGGGKVQKGGAAPQPRWFKKEAFFDKWAGDGPPPPQWLKNMEDGPNAMGRGIGHYFQTFRDIPILLLLMEGVKLIKGFIPKQGSGTSVGDLLAVGVIVPIFMVLLICLHLVFNLGSVIGGIFYRQDEFSWITPALTWPILSIFGVAGSLFIFLLLMLMPSMDRSREWFKYYGRYNNIWLLVTFSVALNEILKVFDVGLNINRWNMDHKIAIIPIIVGLALVILKSIYDFFNYLF